MKPTELAEQVDIEFEAIQLTIDEIASLRKDVSVREPTVRELAAAGLFLANPQSRTIYARFSRAQRAIRATAFRRKLLDHPYEAELGRPDKP